MDEKSFVITDEEIAQNGVESADHYIKGDPDENQKIFDKLPRLIAQKVNAFIEAVIVKFKGYYTKTEIDDKENTLNKSIGEKANASEVYKKTETYSQTETDRKINEKVTELGAGDMAKAVYDPDGDGKVASAENADNATNAQTAQTAQTAQNVRGFWIDYGDAEGNDMENLYVHYYEDEETGEIVTQIT